MKEKIHPKFYTDCKVTCGCGNTFTTAQHQEENSIYDAILRWINNRKK